MNMKKTIAAVSAAAVAVSAMAATVSAEETTKTYTYSLIHKEKDQTTKPTATFEATIQDAFVAGGTQAQGAAALGAGNTGTIAAGDLDQTKAAAITTATTYTCATAATAENLTIDATATTAGHTIASNATAVANFKTAAGAATTLTLTYDGTDWKNGSTTVTMTDLGVTTTGGESNGDTITITLNAATNATWTGGNPVTDLIISQANANKAAVGDTIEITVTNVPTDAKSINRIKFNCADGANKYTVKSVTLKVNAKAAGDQNKTYVYTTTNNDANFNPNLSNTGLNLVNELQGYTGPVDVTVTVVAETTYGSYGDINNWGNDDTHKLVITADTMEVGSAGADAEAFAVTTVTTCKNYAGGADTAYDMPFKSSNTNNLDIIAYLEGRNLGGEFHNVDRVGDNNKWNDAYYNNVMAVINDAVKNSSNVTFKFNTATSGLKYVVEKADGTINWAKIYADKHDWESTSLSGYLDALTAANGVDGKVHAIYSSDWDADTSFTKFGQHLYDWFYAPENTGNAGFDWSGTNLFAGALVINEGFTMSLSETDVFDWTETSLSFDWDSIQQNAMTDNDYANYIHSMKLATSTRWYWDSMDLIITQGEAEDAGADAGADGDGAEIEEDETGDEEVDLGEEEEETEPEEEETEPEETEAEPVVDEPASNPTTGNASVALAVIPVALAAAAIVAKKRG